VGDLVEGILLASTSERAIGEVINLGTGEDIAIRRLAQIIHERTESKSELRIGELPTRPNEIWQMKSDASKAKKLLGWEPQTEFAVGLDLTIEWFKQYLNVYYSADSSVVMLCEGQN
jgi:dTDP-glucose 4,6-dehydratase